MDNGGGSKDGKEGGEKKGKIAAKLGTMKQREPRRGLGVAKLEAIRIQDEMRRMYIRNHLSQHLSAVSKTGINSLEGNRMVTTNPLPSYQHQPYPCRPSFPQQISLSNFAGTVVVSNGLPCYQPAYGRGSVPYPANPNSSVRAYGYGGQASGYYKLPIVRFGSSEASPYANPTSNMEPTTTLSLFKETSDHHKEGASPYLKRQESQNPGESTSKDSNDPHDELDLDLKL